MSETVAVGGEEFCACGHPGWYHLRDKDGRVWCGTFSFPSAIDEAGVCECHEFRAVPLAQVPLEELYRSVEGDPRVLELVRRDAPELIRPLAIVHADRMRRLRVGRPIWKRVVVFVPRFLLAVVVGETFRGLGAWFRTLGGFFGLCAIFFFPFFVAARWVFYGSRLFWLLVVNDQPV